ncbi:Craniofacial development protein 1 [Linum perenne]
MAYLGLKPKISGSPEKNSPQKGHGEQTNGGIPRKETGSSSNKSSAAVDQTSPNKSDSWKNYLGMGTKQAQSSENDASRERCNGLYTSTSEEAKKLAATALSAVKDAAAAAAMRGKVEIIEVRDFAGRDIEVKKLVDAESKEAAEKGKSSATSAVDAVLEQIKKKQKLSVLDKTKKDWGEFKEENKGLEDELQTYKKSSNQYLDRVSFLQRTDYREIKSKI